MTERLPMACSPICWSCQQRIEAVDYSGLSVAVEGFLTTNDLEGETDG